MIKGAKGMIATVDSGQLGVTITRLQQDQEPYPWRIMPWHDKGKPEVDELAAFIRGCLADAYHSGRTDAMEVVSRRDIAQIMFDTPPCPDGEGGVACNYCKTDAVMAYLASVILTAH